MPVCPVCLGECRIDFRDDDAMIAEEMSDEQLAWAEAHGMVRQVGIIDCEECEATGVVSEERARDLTAVATAAVEQALAAYYDKGGK